MLFENSDTPSKTSPQKLSAYLFVSNQLNNNTWRGGGAEDHKTKLISL